MFQFPGCRPLTLRQGSRRMSSGGLPHSEISGSKPVCGSPKLIAAYHVLHRLLVPSHPPLALCYLTTKRFFFVRHESWRTSKNRILGVTIGRYDIYLAPSYIKSGCRFTSIQLSKNQSSFTGDDRDRTGDLLLAKQALSQLSYVPLEPQAEKKAEDQNKLDWCPGRKWSRTTDPRVISTVL